MKAMPGRTLRGRLTLLYGILLTLGLAFYAVGTSVYLLHELKNQQDISLDRDIETVEGLISLSPGGEVELRSEEGEARADSPERGYLLEIWSANGKPVYLSEGLDGATLGSAPDVTKSPLDMSPHSYRLQDGTRVRGAARLHKIDGRALLLRLAVSEEPLWDEFWDMVSVLAIGLPVTVLLIGFAGYAVAGKALQPVDEMAQRARKISAERLNERLAIQNPSDELGHLGLAFNETLARLEKSFEQLRRFTADASHELRTPLTAIRSVGEVALQNPGDTTLLPGHHRQHAGRGEPAHPSGGKPADHLQGRCGTDPTTAHGSQRSRSGERIGNTSRSLGRRKRSDNYCSRRCISDHLRRPAYLASGTNQSH
jgi:HAMP domain-containing protein